MIYSLTGKIIKKTLNAVVICCGGVGYYAQCPASVAGALPGVGNEATIYTVMNVTALPARSSRPVLSCSPRCRAWARKWALPS